jgi:cytochrome P450
VTHIETPREPSLILATSEADLLAGSIVRDPHPLFGDLREQAPIVWLESHRAWMFTDYESVREAFRDERLSSDRLTPIESRLAPERRAVLAQTLELLRGWMVFHDPPEHPRLREPLRRAFTPRRIANLTPRIEAIVAELLIELERNEAPDLIRDFAFPLPAIVIAELLGVPASDREEFKHWSDQLATLVFGTSNRSDPAEHAAAGSEQFAEYFHWLIEKYTAEPEDNLISALIAVTSDDPAGYGLSRSELVGACTLLLFGGHETTTNLIGNSMLSLMTHPDEFAWLRSNPEQLAPSLEELHRFDGSTKLMVRVVAEDHRRGEVDLEAGQNVFLGVMSANRDETVYPQANELRLQRTHPRGHLGFGYGIHFCLGAALARLETHIAVQGLIERFPNITVEPEDAVWRATLLSRGLEQLPVELR